MSITIKPPDHQGEEVFESATTGINHKKLIGNTAIAWLILQLTVVTLRVFTMGIEYVHLSTPLSMILTFTLYILLRRGYREKTIAIILLCNIATLMLYYCYISSGFKGPVIYILVLFPIMAFLLIDHFAGWVTCILTVIVFFTFGYLNFIDYPLPTPAIQGNRIFIARAFSVSFVVLLASWIGWYYTRVHEEFLHSIREKNTAIAMASKHKSNFIASMSHELRTPLNAIIGFSQRLLRKFSDEDNSREQKAIESIHRNGVVLLNLVSDVLDIAKIEAGKISVNPDSFDLLTLIDSTVSDIASMASEKQLPLIVNKPDGMSNLDVILDPNRIRQILTNLLSNAIKYTEAGEINVNVTTDDAAQTVSITVTDTGCGIPENEIENLFKQFQRLEQHENSAINGTGLGLVIVSELVQRHHGHIEVSSERGKGSQFTVVLPQKLSQRDNPTTQESR